MARAEQRPVNTCERPPRRGGETFFATPASKKTVENQSIECSITGNGVERNSLAMTRLTLAGTLALTCAVILIPPATASHSGSDHGLAHRPPSQPKSDPKPPAKPAPKPHPLAAVGVIQSLDTASLTLVPPRKGAAPLTLTVDDNTQIRLGGQPAHLSDLQVGDHVAGLYLPSDGKASALRLEVTAPHQAHGTLTLIDAIQNLIAITTPQGVAVTLKVDASTKVIVDGKAGGLADLKSELVGQHAIALFQPGGNPPLARQVIVMTRGAESPGEG